MIRVSQEFKWNPKAMIRLRSGAMANYVEVGYPESAAYPNGTKIGTVARTMEFGTAKIPPRPFVRPAVAGAKAALRNIAVTGLKGARRFDDFLRVFRQLGSFTTQRVSESIGVVTAPPLSDRTVKARRKRGNYSTKPLEDTGRLRGELAYRVAHGDWRK